jgi:hypothetical protein
MANAFSELYLNLRSLLDEDCGRLVNPILETAFHILESGQEDRLGDYKSYTGGTTAGRRPWSEMCLSAIRRM